MPSARGLAERARRLASEAPFRQAVYARGLLRRLTKASPALSILGVEEADGLTFVHARDSVITPWYVAVGNFQKWHLEQIVRWCDELEIPLGGAFLDVGANIGSSTLYAMRSGRFSSAMCIEPAPTNLRLVDLNLAVNGLTDKVHVVRAACASQPGTAELWLSEESEGDHRLAAGETPSTHRGSVTVETVTLDQALERVGLAPGDVSIVWVDTQGHELEVLKGGGAVIGGGAPFMMELWPGELRRVGALDELLDLLEARFERFADLGEVELRLRPIEEIRGLSASFGDTGQTDVFMLPRRP